MTLDISGITSNKIIVKKIKMKGIKSKKSKSVSELKKKADAIFSKFIRARDKGKCFTCGNVKEPKYQQAGHYVSRVHNMTRYDEKNVHCQCRSCNLFKAGNMDEYTLRLVDKYGDGILEELNKKKHQIKQFRHWELEELIEKYKIKLRELK